MSTTRDLVRALKAALKSEGVTYARLATALGLSESSVKRIFASGDMTLSRIDEVLRVLKMDFAELARRVADADRPQTRLTLDQEREVIADRELLVLTICCLSEWSIEQVVATYALSEAQCVRALLRLDRLGVIELRANNRYRLKIAKGFRWRPDGPVMAYFRQTVVGDFFAGGFDGDGELLTIVHGQIAGAEAAVFVERLQRLCDDFAQQHRADQKLGADRKQARTLLIGMREWWFAPLQDMKRVRRD